MEISGCTSASVDGHPLYEAVSREESNLHVAVADECARGEEDMGHTAGTNDDVTLKL